MKPFALALILPAIASAASPAPLGHLDGGWVLKQDAEIPEAIAQTTEGMPFLSQQYAKARLSTLNPAYQRLNLQVAQGRATVQFDGRQPQVLPLDQTTSWTREDGQSFWVTSRAEGNRLVQVYKAVEGTRTNLFSLSSDGRTLILYVKVESPKLPKPLRYRLEYTRG